MFRFSWFAPPAYVFSWRYLGFAQVGYPIRESPARLARQLTEAYRSLATPFIAH